MRNEAIMLILAAFDAASHDRVNTPPEVTMAEGVVALRSLGVTPKELVEARRELGWATR